MIQVVSMAMMENSVITMSRKRCLKVREKDIVSKEVPMTMSLGSENSVIQVFVLSQ